MTTPIGRSTCGRTRRMLLGAGAGLLLGKAAAAQPAPYPSRPIRLLVGFPAGGAVDAIARLVAPRLSALLGQPVIVENRAGASGIVAATAAAQAPPDGYTLFLGDSSTLIAPFLQPALSFDPLRSFSPVAGAFRLPMLIMAGNDFPARTTRELITALKAQPGGLAYATPGIGTVHHLAFELFQARTGTAAVHVPYRGAVQIIPDLIAGQVQLAVVTATAAIAQVSGGRLRAIAVLSADKPAGAEGVPSVVEDLPGFDAAPAIFLLAPAGTPSAVIGRVSEAWRAMMADPALIQGAAALGATVMFQDPEALRAAMSLESDRWGTLIRENRIVAG